jgi:uncharacterized membrane protein YfcA
MDFTQVFLSLIFGGIIGLSLGLLGGGGSILTVPVLVYIIGQNVHAATGTSLMIVGSSAFFGALFYSRRGEVLLKSGLVFGFMSMIGAVPGAWLNGIVAGEVILVLFSVLMLVVGMVMLRGRTSRRQPESRVPCETYALKNWLKISAIGLLVGVLAGFFGIGGGFLIVPTLVLLGNFPIHQAVGTSLLVIALTSFAGFITHLTLGGIDFAVMLIFVAGSTVGVLAGTKAACRISGQKLDRAFGLFTIFVALLLIYLNIFA